MRRPAPLPKEFTESFAVADAVAAGVAPGRLYASDLRRPFRGVRLQGGDEDDFVVRVRAAAQRLKPGQCIAGATAARLHGIPLPRRWSPDEDIVVVAGPDMHPPRTPGIRGHRLDPEKYAVVDVAGVPVIDPIAAVLSLNARSSLTRMVTMMDALITIAQNYPTLRESTLPLASREEIQERIAAWGPFRGVVTARRALQLARERVESPKESETRMMIVEAGLPEPAVQVEVWHRGRLRGRTDLAYEELRIAIEYEGDGHRTDVDQWRRDVERQRQLEAAGWIVLRLTQHDLGEGRQRFLTTLRRAIRQRA